jgi:hypothetical protein
MHPDDPVVLKTPDGHGLGRIISPDARDENFRVRLTSRTLTPEQQMAIARGWRYWHSGEPFLDQDDEPACVGFAWAHWLDAGPIRHSFRLTNRHGMDFYKAAKRHDEWPGEDYDGSSIRGGAKALVELGYASEYRWAKTAEEAAHSILLDGPMVVGFEWTMDMHVPRGGIMRASGRSLGGHAFVLTGVSTKLEMFRVKNSWGRSWADQGRSWLPFSDFDALMPNWGEACIALEVRR